MSSVGNGWTHFFFGGTLSEHPEYVYRIMRSPQVVTALKKGETVFVSRFPHKIKKSQAMIDRGEKGEETIEMKPFHRIDSVNNSLFLVDGGYLCTADKEVIDHVTQPKFGYLGLIRFDPEVELSPKVKAAK